MLIVSPGGDALLEVGSRHLLSIGDEYDLVGIDVEAALQFEIITGVGEKAVLLCSIERDFGVQELGDIPGIDLFLKISEGSRYSIPDRYLQEANKQLGRKMHLSELSLGLRVLLVEIIESQLVRQESARNPEAILDDGTEEWDD